MAEGVGFEPTDSEEPPVFQTGALDQLCDPSICVCYFLSASPHTGFPIYSYGRGVVYLHKPKNATLNMVHHIRSRRESSNSEGLTVLSGFPFSQPLWYYTYWRSGRDSNSRSGEPRLTVQQTVPLQPLGYRSITRPRARKTKTKVYGFRSKRNSWGILLFLYKLYRKRWHPLSRIAVYFETQGKECNQKEIKKQQQHFFDTVLFLRGLSGCGGGTRTHDLQLMGLTSYQLLPLRHMVPAVGVEPTTFGV